MLTLVRPLEPTTDKRGKLTKWGLYACACGRTKSMRVLWVEKRIVSSCGCLRKKQLSDQPIGRHPEGQAHFNFLLRTYKCNALKRGLSFWLSKAQFQSVISKPCHYCGALPVKGKNIKTGKLEKMFHGTIVHNGIDRVDNLLGYVEENCVPCCRQCNHAKGNMTQADFVAWIRKTYLWTAEQDQSPAFI